MFYLLLLLLALPCYPQSPQTTYQAALHSIITNLQTNITTMSQQLSHTLNVSRNFSSQPTLQNQILTQGLSNLQAILSPTIGHTVIPYTMITWNCNATSFNNYNTIASNNQQVLVNEKNLQNTLSGLSSCPQVTALNNQYKLLQHQISILQSEFGYLCPVSNNAPPPPTTILPNQRFVNNLNNPLGNWIFGLTNPQSYYNQINNLILSGAQQCPSATPYVDSNNTCISCPSVYDVSIQGCAKCPTGSTFNYSIHQCAYSTGVTVLQNSYPGSNNYIGVQPPFDSKLTSCPASSPFFDGKGCVACATPAYFDYSNSLCLNCQSGLVFSTTSHKCVSNNSLVPPPTAFNSNLNPASQNFVGIPPASNSVLTSCPSATPFYNGVHCISCTLPLYFNFTSNICQQCSISMEFNISTGTCTINPAMVYYTSSINGISNYIGLPPNIPANNNKIVMGCPNSTPFANGVGCVACSLPNFYNFQSNACEICRTGLTFDSTTKSCIPQTSVSNQYNSNIAIANNFMGIVPAYNPALLTCSPGTPFFDGLACITCSAPNYFDFTTLSCQPCPSGTVFNPSNRLCIYPNPSYVTNMSNPNIFYNGNYTVLQASINQQQLANSLATCPSGSPFYDATTNTCISCPSSTPIFNIVYNRCMNCGSNAFFDQTIHICVTTQRIPLSLTRELMNTFNL